MHLLHKIVRSHFNVNSEHFERSVDIFTEFFISPTLDPEHIDVEACG